MYVHAYGWKNVKGAVDTQHGNMCNHVYVYIYEYFHVCCIYLYCEVLGLRARNASNVCCCNGRRIESSFPLQRMHLSLFRFPWYDHHKMIQEIQDVVVFVPDSWNLLGIGGVPTDYTNVFSSMNMANFSNQLPTPPFFFVSRPLQQLSNGNCVRRCSYIDAAETAFDKMETKVVPKWNPSQWRVLKIHWYSIF